MLKGNPVYNEPYPFKVGLHWIVKWNNLGMDHGEDQVLVEQLGDNLTPTGIFIDVGWYGDPEDGIYAAVSDCWDKPPFARKESLSLKEIVETIEHWMFGGAEEILSNGKRLRFLGDING